MRFLDLFLGSFYSARAYRYMRYERRGLGLAYSFLLVALTSILFVVYLIAMVNSTLFATREDQKPLFDDAVDQIIEQMPEMTIENGTVTVTSPQPHYVKLRIEVMGKPVEGALLTIDTTGATTYEHMRTPLLLTGKEIIARSNGEIKIHPISEYYAPGEPPLHLDRAKFKALGDGLVQWVHTNLAKLIIGVGLVLWIAVTLFLYLMRLAMTLALGIAAVVVGSVSKASIDLSAAMRLSALAYTPVAVIDIMVMGMLNRPLPTAVLFLLGGAMVYVTLRASTVETP